MSSDGEEGTPRTAGDSGARDCPRFDGATDGGFADGALDGALGAEGRELREDNISGALPRALPRSLATGSAGLSIAGMVKPRPEKLGISERPIPESNRDGMLEPRKAGVSTSRPDRDE